MRSVCLNISTRLYGWLLLAYPSHFRRQFGGQMRQTFRDCSYFEADRGRLISFWLRTLVDLVLTAAQERTENSARKGVFMNNTRRFTLPLLACVGIIVIAFLLLDYGKRHEVSSILAFGYFLDALVVGGVIGNFIVFLLMKTTKFNPRRVALATFAIVHALLLLLIFIIARGDPGSINVNGTVLAHVASFLFWTALHWAWHRRGMRQLERV